MTLGVKLAAGILTLGSGCICAYAVFSNVNDGSEITNNDITDSVDGINPISEEGSKENGKGQDKSEVAVDNGEQKGPQKQDSKVEVKEEETSTFGRLWKGARGYFSWWSAYS